MVSSETTFFAFIVASKRFIRRTTVDLPLVAHRSDPTPTRNLNESNRCATA